MEIGKAKDWEVEIGRVELLMVNRSVVAPENLFTY